MITPFSGSGFWLASLLTFVVQNTIRQLSKKILIKNSFLIVVSTYIVFDVMGRKFGLFAVMLVQCVLVYHVGNRMLCGRAKSSVKPMLAITIALIVVCLCYFKYTIIQNSMNAMGRFFVIDSFNDGGSPSNGHIFLVGISYFSFKFIHFLLECHRKKVENLSFPTFLNYILFFPSFFSGPINRYNQFAACISETEAHWRDDFTQGGKRLINGLFKKIVLGDTLYIYSIAALTPEGLSVSQIIWATYAYMLHVYFNFSGYTDMAIGCGRLVGIELPENFNYPFFKRNIQKFWANWHMSLTGWLTDYIYWPIARKIRNYKYLKKRPVTISNISIVITFFVCGMWHGDGLNFILWGFYHGVGLAILNCYTYLIKRHASQPFKVFVNKSKFAYAVSTFITIQFVAFGFLLFACDMAKLKILFHWN